MIVCPTGKSIYPNKPDAERAIERIRRAPHARLERPIRAYRCDECKGWHVTSSGDRKRGVA